MHTVSQDEVTPSSTVWCMTLHIQLNREQLNKVIFTPAGMSQNRIFMEPKQPLWQTNKAWWAPVLSVMSWNTLSYCFIKKHWFASGSWYYCLSLGVSKTTRSSQLIVTYACGTKKQPHIISFKQIMVKQYWCNIMSCTSSLEKYSAQVYSLPRHLFWRTKFHSQVITVQNILKLC